jgi:RNA polymerase sigma-70 factor (ECF subfamily)
MAMAKALVPSWNHESSELVARWPCTVQLRLARMVGRHVHRERNEQPALESEKNLEDNGRMSSDVSQPQSSEELQQEFQHLIAEVRAGSQDAAWTLIERYGPHIQQVVRRRMHARMRSKFDSVDFVQAVWASFFKERTKAAQFDTPEGLMGFLEAMARNKVVDEVRRRMQTQKYGGQREHTLYEEAAPSPHSQPHYRDTPSQIAVARERWNRLLADLPEHYRQIIKLRYEGETCEQIAAKVGMHERSVRKVIDKLFDGATAD